MVSVQAPGLDDAEIARLMDVLRHPAAAGIDQRYKGTYLAAYNSGNDVFAHHGADGAVFEAMMNAP